MKTIPSVCPYNIYAIMWKLLILCLFAVIYTADAQQSRWINAREATEDDVTSLHSVTVSQALPVILFASKESEQLQRIFGVEGFEIINGRFASGTKFFTIPPVEQIFFCPHPYTSRMCLIPNHFEASEILECMIEPLPVLKKYDSKISCGQYNNGDSLVFSYEICPAQPPYRYITENTTIYTLCYDATAKKVLFVNHTIMVPILFTEDLLIWEQNVKFTMNMHGYGLIDSGYHANLVKLNKKYRDYVLQTLVPPEDMPLATLKKATNYFANFELQHKDLAPRWDTIRHFIRSQAIRLNNQVYSVMTGVFEVPKDEIPTVLGRQIKTIWVTLITTIVKDHRGVADRREGLAVLMYNFISQDGYVGRPQKHYIDKLCNDKDSCVMSFKQRFDDVGGGIRCCAITQDISKLFFYDVRIHPSLTQLQIINITY